MFVLRPLVVIGSLLTLAACVTAPARQTPTSSTAALFLCPGGGISNAPQTDARGRVVGYEPFTTIRGVTLARAPVSGCISSGFGPRNGGASGFHNGVDLYTRTSAPVYAGADGVIEDVSALRGYGNTILIRHPNGVETRYAHLSSYGPQIRRGARVRAGEAIARTGKTGNATAVHLHYEVLVDGRTMNPVTVGR